MEKLLQLYQQWNGNNPKDVEQLPGAGSNRTYYRLTSQEGVSVIGVIGTSRDENHAFIGLSQHFTHLRLPVPEVLIATDDELRYIQRDLGTQSLYDAIEGGRRAGGRYNKKESDMTTCKQSHKTI